MSITVEQGARWKVYLADLRDVLPAIDDADVALFDPPYSRRVHENAMTSRRTDLPDVEEFSCRTKRRIEIGFEHLRPELRRFVARWCADRVKRWSLAFSDVESAWLWRVSFEAVGMNYRRTGEWERIDAAPQFNGMEPAPASEAIVIAHRKGKRHWNGGGSPARWSYPIVANRFGQRGSRVHPTQKPVELMMKLVELFSDEGESVVDMFAGSASTGVAAIRLGRRFIGIERSPKFFDIACERLRAEDTGSTLEARRAGQGALFGGSSG